jgi:hypothetical protein
MPPSNHPSTTPEQTHPLRMIRPGRLGLTVRLRFHEYADSQWHLLGGTGDEQA